MTTSTQPSPPSYGDDIDFSALARHDAEFAKVYDSKTGRVDLHDAEAVKQLTKSLLKRDFGLTLELPADRLCPPVPVRYNYIRWIQDLIDTTGETYTDSYDQSRQVIGIDIGVGASCIYPLLGCSTRPKWLFAGTELDPKNLEYARRNVSLNNLQSRIRIHQSSSPQDPLFPLDALRIQHADFTMCNPPFFTSREEMLATYTNKAAPPSAVCTGAEVEMIYPDGGDLGFVLRMVEESKRLGDRVQWFSSMLGKLASAKAVVVRLKEVGISNWAVRCLNAGGKTRRWAVAWSFDDFRPRNDVARCDMFIKELLPFPTLYIIPLKGIPTEVAGELVNKTLTSLDIRWTWRVTHNQGVGFAKENVWSRSARRRKKRDGAENVRGAAKDEDEDEDSDEDSDEEGVALGFKVTVTKESGVEVRWLQGKDSVLFESFCGMLKRALMEHS